MIRPLHRRLLSIPTLPALRALVAAGLAMTSVSCYQGLGYWQQPQYGPNGQPMYGQPAPYGQPPQQQGGFFRRPSYNTDYAPRYGYNGQMQPQYADPTGSGRPNGSGTGSTSRPKNTKPKGESAANLHKREPSKPKKDVADASTNDPKPEPKTETKPKTTSTEVPYGKPVVGKKGFVYSPHSPDSGMVDVTGIPTGTKVECPYTMKHFRVP